MWLLDARKARRTPSARSGRDAFRPRLEALEDRCLMSAGGLDTSFGIGGLVSGGPIVKAQAVVVYPPSSPYAGKIVVGGYIPNATQAYQWALERYNADGTIDTSFGSGGVVTSTSITIGGQNFSTVMVNGLAIQSDNKIVAVGPVGVPWEYGAARYNPNGTLDSTFNGGNKIGTGFVVTEVHVSTKKNTSTTDWPIAVAIQADGRIVVAGFAKDFPGTTVADFALVRYNTNGALDTNFGPNKNGIVVTPNFGGGNDEARAIAIQLDGKVVVAGGTFNLTGNPFDSIPIAMAVARYTSSGTLDSSFGSNGIVTGLIPTGFSAASASGVVVQSDGKIVAAGYSTNGTSNAVTLARLQTNGTPDPNFGNSGYAINTDLSEAQHLRDDNANAIALGNNGDLLATGSTVNTSNPYFGVAAFLPSGARDTTFGTNGTATAYFSPLGTDSDSADAVAIQGDGKIVVAGGTTPSGSSTSYLALARFLPPNTKIESFAANPNPVTAGSLVTLTVSGIVNSNPTSTIAQVAFYVDTNGDGILEPGTDQLLGYGTNNSGTWTFTFATTGLTAGNTYTLFAQAADNYGVLSDPVTVSLQVA
jgi:uncharacterized delta-60 repeat protein